MRRRALMLSALAAPAAASAQDLPLVFAAGAVKHAVEELRSVTAFAAEYDTVGALRDRVKAGERPDAALLSAEAVETLVARGLADARGAVALGRTGVALAAPDDGSPLPDIATEAALRAALLAAPSVAQADPARGATAGRHFAALLGRLGIAEQMRPKLRLVSFGVLGVEMAARGEVALAVSQATEIVGRPGVRLVGLLPEALNVWTPYVAARVRDGEAARAMLALFASARAREAFARIGFAGGG